MRYIPILVSVVLATAMIDVNAQSPAPNVEKAAADKAVNLCSTCHGPRGISTSPEFPMLAGQREVYLIGQLKAFRDRTRADKDGHDFMWGIAAQLDDPTIEGIAHYYSEQPSPAGRSVDPAMAKKGKDLFDTGAPDRDIPACTTCHGQSAEGGGDAEQPRLAGQHAKYVAKQLRYMQTQERETVVMREAVKDLTPEEREAVAAHVQSLGSASMPHVGSAH